MMLFIGKFAVYFYVRSFDEERNGDNFVMQALFFVNLT